MTLIFVTGIFSVSEHSHQTSDILLDLTCLNFFVDSWWLTWLDLLCEISFTCILPWSILQYFAKDNKGVKANEIYCSFYNLWMIKQNRKKFPLIFMVFNKKDLKISLTNDKIEKTCIWLVKTIDIWELSNVMRSWWYVNTTWN